MIFLYKDKEYPVEIVKKNNKNTYVRVKNNTIYVTTNYFTTNKIIQKLLDQNKQSIYKMIEKSKQRESKKEVFSIFGKSYDIIYGNFLEDITIDDNKIYAKNEKVLSKWLNELIHNTYQEHLTHWYNIFTENIPIPNLKIRKMTSRWGVCNTKNHNVTLNSELLKYDIECLDYVIVHELSHFLVPNHSKKFWNVVEKYYPNYKEIRRKLKE